MARTTLNQSTNYGDNNSNCGNTIGSYNTTTTINQSGEDAEILRWLSPLEPKDRHHGVRTDRFEGVGDWLLETSEFRGWRDSDGGAARAVLFCSGHPGVGKTYLSSLVIDRLGDQAKGDIVVACLYCDYLAQQEQTITNILGAILKQLVGGRVISENLREAFQEGKNVAGGRRLLLPDLVHRLKITISSRSQVFICLDALDECLPKTLPELLQSLSEIIRECPRTRVFLTGRPHVRETVQKNFPKAAVIPVSPNTEDIKNYLEMRLDRDDEPEAMDNDLRADIVRIILDKMSDIFLLVSLNIDSILGGMTIGQRRKKLREMARGNGLSDAYMTTLTRLKAQKGNKSVLGLNVLMWVLNSQRPLRTDDLCHALGVEVGSTDLDPENIPALKTLLSSCLGLVTVEASSSTVRLVHFTLQEYLSSDHTLFPCPHSIMAEVCLTYLNFGYVRDLSPDVDCAASGIPFLDYASCYWGEHARREMTENVKALALRLLDRFDEHISASLLLLHYNEDSEWERDLDFAEGSTEFTGLHAAACLGIMEIFAAILKMEEWDVNAGDCFGSTALTWAAERGHERVIKMLLEQEDINPDKADIDSDRTPLMWGAASGHEGVVKMLLEREDVNPNATESSYDCTALSWAADSGRAGVVKALLEREDVNPNQQLPDSYDTILLWAAENGYEGVVKMLLSRDDLDPNQLTGEDGAETILTWAVKKGDKWLVKRLLEREDVNPNLVEGCHWKPLLSAASKGDKQLVKMLLDRKDVNPNQVDDYDGATPLSQAAENGHEGVVKMLLERKDVNPDQADTKSGRTPLSFAAAKGREGVVRMLLDRKEINPDHADTKGGWAPLSLAAVNGHEGVVKMLLERKEVNPDRADTKGGWTPLLLAAGNGHEGIVKILLERKCVNPNQVDTSYYRTPLSWAAANGRAEVVKILLERKEVNPEHADTEGGWTPLSLAAGNGHGGVVKLLMERKDVNPDHADTQYGQTPLSWAAKNGHVEVVKMLLGREVINPNHADTWYGRTPLSWAAENGHEGVVKVLLEREDIDPRQRDIGGWTPLCWAVKNMHQRVIGILLERWLSLEDMIEL